MVSYNEAIYINKRKVTTYLMKVEGGLSAPLLPYHNAASLYFWESNWKVFSGDVCIRQHMRKHMKVPYIYRKYSKESYFNIWTEDFFQTDTFLLLLLKQLFKHCIFPQQKRFSY